MPTLERRAPAGTRDAGPVLRRAAELAAEFIDSLAERDVRVEPDVEALRKALVFPLPEAGEDPVAVVEALVRDADRGIVAMAGPRYFGFVIGGSLPAALAADWLTSTWDQNAGLYVAGPAASVVEEAAGAWLLDVFGLPADSSFGFTTGCQMAHFTCLGAARHEVLRRAGWDVEVDGLFGAPEMSVIVGAEAHTTVFAALQYLGMGRGRVRVAETDEQGRLRIDSLRTQLDAVPRDQPLIVCLQAGNVNTGSFDPLREAIGATRAHANVWVHVDGAFGLWGRVAPGTAAQLDGVEDADSWATDAHKWLNVPYDSGLAFVRDQEAHAAAMSPPHAPYLQYTSSQERDEVHWVPEFSRRARGFAVYAALRSLGRAGVRELVEASCRQARAIAARIAEAPSVRVLNDVVLNQVLVRFETGGDTSEGDALTKRVVKRVQDDARIWLSGTTWHGVAAMRISVSNWSTTDADAEIAAEAILDALRAVRDEG